MRTLAYTLTGPGNDDGRFGAANFLLPTQQSGCLVQVGKIPSSPAEPPGKMKIFEE